MRLSDTGGRVLNKSQKKLLVQSDCPTFAGSVCVQWTKKMGRTVFYLAPLLEMSSHNLFRLGPCTRLFDTPNVERAVLSRESPDATHVISIVRKLVAREAVLARIGQRPFRIRERV